MIVVVGMVENMMRTTMTMLSWLLDLGDERGEEGRRAVVALGDVFALA